MLAPSASIDQLQAALTFCLGLIVAVAGWGLFRFVRVVDALEVKVEALNTRVAVIEVKQQSQQQFPSGSGARQHADAPIRRPSDT